MNLNNVLTVAKGVADTVEVVKDFGNVFKDEKEIDSNKEKLVTKIDDELSVTKSLTEIKKENRNLGIDKTINDIEKTLEENIALEVDKLNLNESFFEKISKTKLMDIIKISIEAVLKGVLKKKVNINYSTFNDMKESINSVMDGNLKDALKESSDVAINKIDSFDAITKTAIKTIKNAVIDKTIDGKKYEIINKQTKVLNRISDNCEKFSEAMKINDEKTMKNVVNKIKKDMKEILPIRETISKAQNVFDKYSLWENKGKEPLTNEENELIEKLNLSA